MLTRIWNRICEWLAEPVYLQTVPWTWSVAEPKQPALVIHPHTETLVLGRAGIKVWTFRIANAAQETSPENRRIKRYSLPKTWQQARQEETQEEHLP